MKMIIHNTIDLKPQAETLFEVFFYKKLNVTRI